jgi:hypothetical protein
VPTPSTPIIGRDGTHDEDAALAKVSEAEDEPEEVSTGMSEAQSQEHRGNKTPTLMPQNDREISEHESVRKCFSLTIRRSGKNERRETLDPPVLPRRA